MEIPFLRHATSILALAPSCAARCAVLPSGEVVRCDVEDASDGDLLGAAERLLGRWGRASRFVALGLPPAWVNHAVHPMPDLVDEEVAEWLAARRGAGSAHRASEAGRYATVLVQGTASPVALAGSVRGDLVERLLGLLRAAGCVPVEAASLLPALGYAEADESSFAGRRFTLTTEDGAAVRFAEGYPADVWDRFPGDAAAEPTPALGGAGALEVLPAAEVLPAVAAEDAAWDPYVRALAALVRYPGLPRLSFLSDDERQQAQVARDRVDAGRVLAATALLVLALGGLLGMQLRQARTSAVRARAAFAAQRPDLAALEAAEARAASSDRQAAPARLSPLLDAAARRVPQASGVQLTAVEAWRDSSGRPEASVEGFAVRAPVLPGYVQALEAERPRIGAVRLLYATQAERPAGALAFALRLEGGSGAPSLPQ